MGCTPSHRLNSSPLPEFSKDILESDFKRNKGAPVHFREMYGGRVGLGAIASPTNSIGHE